MTTRYILVERAIDVLQGHNECCGGCSFLTGVISKGEVYCNAKGSAERLAIKAVDSGGGILWNHPVRCRMCISTEKARPRQY